MPVQLWTNNATTLLDADIGSGDTSLTVTTGDGALFPAPAAGDWFYATIQSGSLIEIIQVTTRVTDDFTVIVRAQDGTSAIAWTAGATIELRVTKAWLDRVLTQDTNPSVGDVTGPAGGVVDNEVVFFDGTTGKLVKASGLLLSGSNTGDQVLPIDSTITVTDNTGNNATTSAHGWLPRGTNSVWHFLRSDVTYAAPPSNTGLPDPIVNGSFNLWQRGTNFVTPASSDYTADQFAHIDSGSSGSVDVSRVTLGDTPIFNAVGQLLNYGLRYDVNTIDASVAAGDVIAWSQAIEGWRAVPYMHNEFTVSFYVRSNITGTFGFSIRNSGADRSFVKSFTVDVVDTWERKTITVPVQDRAGTWDYTTGIGLDLRWTPFAGTDFEGTDNVWQTGNLLTVSGQTNWMATATNNFDFTGLQIDLGPDAQAYRGVPYEEDLHAAERYYQKSYDTDVDPGATSALGQVACIQNTTTHKEHVTFRTPMRAAPTVAAINPTDGTTAEWEDVTGGVGEAVTIDGVGMTGFTVNVTAGTDNSLLNGHWTARSEL